MIRATRPSASSLGSGMCHAAQERGDAPSGLSEFVGLIYDTALDPDAWPTVLNRLATCSRLRPEPILAATIRGPSLRTSLRVLIRNTSASRYPPRDDKLGEGGSVVSNRGAREFRDPLSDLYHPPAWCRGARACRANKAHARRPTESEGREDEDESSLSKGMLAAALPAHLPYPN
jgi:hypothetical protein